MSDDQGAIGLVNAKFNDARSYSQSAFSTANALLNNLAGTALVVNVTPIDTEITLQVYDPAIGDFSAPSVSIPKIPDAPDSMELLDIPDYDIDKVTFEDNYPSDPHSPTTKAVPALDITDAPDFKGDLVIPDVDISDLIAQASTILRLLRTSLSTVGATLFDFITNPKQAIGDDLVDAMTASALQKVDDDFQVKYNEVNTYFSSRGWSVPTGVLAAKLSEIDKAHATQRAYIQRDVLIKNFELSQQNFLASMQLYIQYTQANNALLSSTLQQLYEAAKYTFDAAISKFNAYVAMFNIESEVYKLNLSAKVQKVTSVLEVNRGIIAQYGAEIQAYVAKIGAIGAYNENLSRQQTSEIQAYSAEVQAISSHNAATAQMYSGDIQKYTADIQAAVTTADVSIKQAQLQLQSYDTVSRFEISKAEVMSRNAQSEVAAKQAGIQMAISQADTLLRNATTIGTITAEVAKAAATIAAQLAASSLSAVSAGATVGFQEHFTYDQTKDIVETKINLTGPA